ncbi:hypothetical protein E3A20_03410 [Planctomyces bekefii]|uniref:Uncharacterized protein n=1 Tax=Planctomyces bekefii TaxID=1653850 RepID=A0A5C6MGT7_9PLAN|nr:hypothetical protein E3A20_03410 [Planctomyces bekefii]
MQVAVDTPREIGPRLAFGEALAASGFDDLATEYFVELAETTKSAWVAIRGFDALSKPELDQVQGSGRNASDFVRIAWELSKTGELRNDRGFLTQLSSAAMAVRAEDVLGEILSDAFIDSGDHRLLARVCLDEFCFHLRSGKEGKDTTVSRWKWQDAWRSPAIVQFTKVLISEQKDRAFVRTEVESCAREWRDAKMLDELGWLSVLVMRIDETEPDLQLLTWLESILNDLSTEVESNWHVVKVLVEHFVKVPPVLKSRAGILAFAFATMQGSKCEKLEVLVDAASWLLVAEHKSAEVALIVETWLDQRPQSCHWVNRKLAVACSRQPSTQELANGYLNKLRYEDRVNVLDEISVCRNDNYLARLKTRLQFPLTTENLQKVHDLTRGYFLECMETEHWKSGDVAFVVKQLNPCGTDAEVHLAEMIGKRLSREQAVSLRDFAAEL